MAKFLKWIVNIILLCSILVAGALLIPPLVGVTTVMVDEVDMETNLQKGSVTYARDTAVDEIEPGDKILVTDDGNYVYRVKNVDSSDGTCKLEDTRTPNSEEVTKTFKNSVPKVVLTVPFIGYIPMAMKSTEGLIVIGLVVVFVIILFVLAELWRPEEDEEDEEEEDKELSENPSIPEKPPVSVDVSSIIMEEASNEIASMVSSVVAEEQMESEKASSETEEQASQDIERAILNYEDLFEEEAETSEDLFEVETGEAEELPEHEEIPEEPEETPEIAEEEEIVLTKDEEEEPEEEMETERELAMPLYTAQELIVKAKEKGEEPDIIQDADTGVTILDYSKLL